jgi:hypothetical protein
LIEILNDKFFEGRMIFLAKRTGGQWPPVRCSSDAQQRSP